MTTIHPSAENFNPQSMLLKIDGKITDELHFISQEDKCVGVLERLDWQLVHCPEPSILYYVVSLYDALAMGAICALTVDKDIGVGYCVPICCILAHGNVHGSGERQKISLPLREWDILFDRSQPDEEDSQAGEAS